MRIERISWKLCLLAVLVVGLSLGLPVSPASSAARPPRVSAVGTVELVAGSGDPKDGGKAIDGYVVGVAGMAVDPQGNLYFSDAGSGRVRKIDVQSGTIDTIAGNGKLISEDTSNRAVDRALRAPGPLAIDATGQSLYVGETIGRRVQRVDLSNGTMQELPIPEGGGFGEITGLIWTPTGLVVADSGRDQLWKLARSVWIGLSTNGEDLRGGIRGLARDRMGHLYISEYSANRVLKFDTNTGRLTPFAGTGKPGKGAEGQPAAGAALHSPDGLAFDTEGNLLVSDLGNRRIVRIDAETQKATTLHESSHQGQVMDWSPGALACDREGNLWVGDVHRDRVLRFLKGATQPAVVVGGADIGDGRPATEAHLALPGSVVSDRFGNIYIADTLHHRVRIVDPQTGRIHTLAGTGTPGYNGDGIAASSAWLSYPAQLQVAGDGRLYIADSHNNRVRVYDPASGTISTLAGNGQAEETGDGGPAKDAGLLDPHCLYLDGPDTLVVTSGVTSTIRRVVLANGRIYRVPLSDPSVPADRVIYGVGRWNASLVLAMPRPVPGSIDLLARNGSLTRLFNAPQIEFPYHVAVSPEEQLFISDTGRGQVLRWTGQKMEVVAKDLGRPRSIAFDPKGDLLIADTFYNRILRVYLHEPPAEIASRGHAIGTAVAAGPAAALEPVG